MHGFWKDERDLTQGVLLRPEYAHILGGRMAAAVLLAQIVYWHKPKKDGSSRLTVKREGQMWIAKSREEWCAETGLTLDTFKGAISLLKAQGIVIGGGEIEWYGKRTAIIRLDLDLLQKKIEQWCKVHQLVGGNSTDYVVGVDSTNPSVEITPTKTETTSTEITETTVQADDSAEATDPPMSEAKKLVDQIQGKQPTSLPMLWKKRMAQVYGSYQKALTKKEEAQLKQFATAVSGMGWVPIEVLDWAIQNWDTFAYNTKAAKGLHVVPHHPVVGFVLSHHDILVQSIAAKDEKKAPVVDTTPKVAATTEEKAVFTPEQIAADIAKFTKGTK